MRGHVAERQPGVWRVFYDLPPDPVTGRRRQRTATVRGSREDAERELARLILTRPDPTSLTVSQLADEWLTLIQVTVRPSTLAGYRTKLGNVAGLIGGRPVRDVTPRLLTDLYRRLPHSAQTVLHVHRVLHRMFSDAVRLRLIDRNPAEGAIPPRVPKPRLQVWTADEAARFLYLAQTYPCFPLFRLALTTGMRRGELCGLRWVSVNLPAGRLTVSETSVFVDGHPIPSLPKTAAGRRSVALDGETVRVLTAHRARQAEALAYFGIKPEWVFCWDDGRPWSPDWVGKQFRSLVRGSPLPPIRFHDLRHTYATLALEAGVPAKVVADRLGHSTIAITLDTYTHRSDGLDREAAEMVAGLVAGNGLGNTTAASLRILADAPANPRTSAGQ